MSHASSLEHLTLQQGQLSKTEIEDLLKKGAYGALMDDDNAGDEFCEQNIDDILERRTQVIQIEAGIKGSTFSKASFNMTETRSDISLDDPNFWQKWARKADIDTDDKQVRVCFCACLFIANKFQRYFRYPLKCAEIVSLI